MTNEDYTFIVAIISFLTSIITLIIVSLRKAKSKSFETPMALYIFFLLVLQNSTVSDNILKARSDNQGISPHAVYPLCIVALTIIALALWILFIEKLPITQSPSDKMSLDAE